MKFSKPDQNECSVVCLSRGSVYFFLWFILFYSKRNELHLKRRQEAFEKSGSSLFISTFIIRKRKKNFFFPPINLFVVPVSWSAAEWFVNKRSCGLLKGNTVRPWPVQDEALWEGNRSTLDGFQERQRDRDRRCGHGGPLHLGNCQEEIERKPLESCRPVTPISLSLTVGIWFMHSQTHHRHTPTHWHTHEYVRMPVHTHTHTHATFICTEVQGFSNVISSALDLNVYLNGFMEMNNTIVASFMH